MRSDHLKRHMKIHVDLSWEDQEQICKSILEDVINDIQETSMYKRKDLNSDGLDESPLSSYEIDDEELEKTLLYHHNKYAKKLKLGARVAKLIKNKGILPDSGALPSGRQHFIKYTVRASFC